MPVPDITGQPAWVVIVVMLLVVLATLGVAYLAYLTARRKSATEDKPEQATLPTGGDNNPTILVMQAALGHLARVADREAAESEEARKEAGELRTRLEAQLREVIRLQQQLEDTQRQLDNCQARAELLSEQAFRRGHEHG